MTKYGIEIQGALVTLPLPGKKTRPLDGFWLPGRKTNPRLLIFVHGMGGNFYRSQLRKQLMLDAPGSGFDMLLFNNRGAEKDVATEKFRDCLEDIAAAMRFAREKGYREVTLMGASTGCQKIAYYQALRRDRLVKAIILAAIGDDLAITRRDLGAKHGFWVRKAKQLAKRGKGDTILPECANFSAQRFLSIADPTQPEAQLFDFSGPMRLYRKLKVPVLALLPEQEEHACIPVPMAVEILRSRSGSRHFDSILVPGADHSFHGFEPEASRAAFGWLANIRRA